MLPNQRSLEDVNLTTSHYFPSAGTSHNTAGIDLGALLGDPDPSKFDVEILVAAAPAHLNTGTPMVVTIQDSADNSTFIDTVPVITANIVGVGTSGSAAKTFIFRLPPGVRRYISVYMTSPSVEDNTGVLCTLKLLL